MESLENALFYKPTGTVQIANKFSLIERKLLNAIIWHSQKNKFKREELSISIRDVFVAIGLEKSENYDVIKDALRVLTSTIIEWNTFGEDRVTEWGVCTFLASGVIKSGKMKYMLNPKLVEQINQPTLYAKILLLVQSQIKKRHALVLYEFFLDALGRAQRDSLKMVVSLTNLYHLLGVSQDNTYKIFNRDVIKPSLKEIVKHTDIDVSYTVNKMGRNVHELVFSIEKRETFQLRLDFDMEGDVIDIAAGLDEGKAPVSPILAGIELDLSTEWDPFQALVFHGVGKKKAKALVESFDRERIQGNIEYVIEQQRIGKPIDNTQAYLVKAIEEDYRPKKSPKDMLDEKRKQQKASTAAKAKQAKALKEQQETEWKRFCDQRVKDHFAARPEEWQEEKRQNFIAKIKATNPILYNSYKKDAFNSPMVQAVFYSELREQLLTAPEETSLTHYLKSQGALPRE
jgi:hypothetical protein